MNIQPSSHLCPLSVPALSVLAICACLVTVPVVDKNNKRQNQQLKAIDVDICSLSVPA